MVKRSRSTAAPSSQSTISYIRDCIISPEKQRVAGYAPIMPSFAGQLEEENLLRVIAYIKSLKPTESR